MPRSPRQPGGPFSVDLLHVVLTRAAAPRPSSGAIVRHWRHRQPGGGSSAQGARIAGVPTGPHRRSMSARVARRKHPTRRRFRTGSRPSPSAPERGGLDCALARCRAAPASANVRAPQPPPAPALPPPAPCQHLHVSRMLVSNRSGSRFDQFQLPMTSFVCSCHWPPNRFVTCARRCFRSHAT